MVLNGSHQLLVNPDHVNSVGENIHTVQKNTPFLLVANKKLVEKQTENGTYIYVQ